MNLGHAREPVAVEEPWFREAKPKLAVGEVLGRLGSEVVVPYGVISGDRCGKVTGAA